VEEMAVAVATGEVAGLEAVLVVREAYADACRC
jgi:hypothetical protein